MSGYKYWEDIGESQGEYFGTNTTSHSGSASAAAAAETIREFVKLLSAKEKAALIKELLK